MDTMKKYSWDGGTTRLPVNDEAGRELLKDTVGFTGKNRAYSQTNNAVIASIESGKTYSVSWTGSATITLKKDSVSGTEITSGSTSPLTFTADADYDLYFGSSADVTQIMVCDSALDGEYEEYHDTVESMFEDVADDIDGINLLENKAVSTGIFTVNADKSVTINGTASATLQFQIHGPLDLPNGNYVLTGITELPEGVYWSLQLRSGSWIDVAPGESSKSFTLSSANPIVKARIYVASGTTLSNLVIYPMLTESKYAGIPYRPYNQQSIQNQINDKGVLGAKNLLPIILSTQTENGVTVTANKDSSDNVLSVVLNGTATSSGQFNLNNTSGILNSLLQKYGDLIWSGCPSRNDCRMYTHIQNGSYVTLTNGEEKILSASNNYDANILIQYDNGVTYDNVAFYPMLRLASDPDDTYVPYAMTNRELTAARNADIAKVFLTGVSVSKYGSTDDVDNFPPGVYYVGSNTRNNPVGWGYIITIGESSSNASSLGNYGCQIALGGNNVAMKYRSKVQGTWGEWKTITLT